MRSENGPPNLCSAMETVDHAPEGASSNALHLEGRSSPGWRVRVTRGVNALLYLLGCMLASTALLLAWRLPRGNQGLGRAMFLDRTRHDWSEIHEWLGYAILILVAAHLLLHWAWIYRVAAQRHSLRVVGFVLAGLALIAFALIWPVSRL
jgi:hypothetical protein